MIVNTKSDKCISISQTKRAKIDFSSQYINFTYTLNNSQFSCVLKLKRKRKYNIIILIY
jgi:hypothetical protein